MLSYELGDREAGAPLGYGEAEPPQADERAERVEVAGGADGGHELLAGERGRGPGLRVTVRLPLADEALITNDA